MIVRAPAPYEVIYLDPAWPRTPCGTAKTPYRTMTWEQLHAFDLGAWLSRDAVVFCWVTGPTHLRECAVLSTWRERFGLHEAGIAYVWIKTRRSDAPALPPHYSLHGRPGAFFVRRDGNLVEELCPAHGNTFTTADIATVAAWAHWRTNGPREWVRYIDDAMQRPIPIGASGPRPKLVKQLGEYVIALTTRKRGRVFPLLTEAQTQWVFAPKPRRGDHSRKPAVVRDNIVELLGVRPRVELFAREQVDGWDAWGDELEAA